MSKTIKNDKWLDDMLQNKNQSKRKKLKHWKLFKAGKKGDQFVK